MLDAVIERIQDPESFKEKYPKKFGTIDIPNELSCRALIFDSVYDPYKGVLSYIKVVDGKLMPGTMLHLVHSQTTIQPPDIGYFTPDYVSDKMLSAGQIGYVATGKKSVRDAQIGDTIIGMQ